MAESILEEAERLVMSDKLNEYGSPEDSLENIAGLWTAYVQNKMKYHFDQGKDFELSSKDVTLLMILFKVSREQYNHKRDNLVDAAGYVKLAANIENLD